MKTFISIFALLPFIFSYSAGSGVNVSNEKGDNQNVVSAQQLVTIACSPEVYGLTTNLAKEYGKINTFAKINVITDLKYQSGELQNLSIVDEENLKDTKSASLWKMTIARDAVVPIMNAGNPMLEKISREGLTSWEFARLLKDTEKTEWEAIITGGMKARINLFIPDNEQTKAQIAAFAKIDPAMMKGTITASSREMINTIQQDIYSVGFCHLDDLVDPTTSDFYSKIRIVPIDKNQNGRIDYFENIYAGKDAFFRGVWIGKYPKTLSGNIYAIAPAKPTDKNELAFLEWVISDGQQFLNSSGYTELTSIQKEADVEAMTTPVVPSDVSSVSAISRGWILVLFIIIVAGLMIIPVFILRKKKPGMIISDIHLVSALNEDSLMVPAGVFFGKTHTWAFMEKDGLVKIGIDDFMPHITGSLTRVVMKSPGENVRKGEKALSIIRDGKQLSLYAPVTGVIRENNQRLLTNSSLINSSPYSDGWIYMIEPRNWLKEIQHLLMGEQYREWLKNEFARLKDFFAAFIKTNALVYSHVVFQDGGEISDHVLADLDPEVWEEFQMEFIDQLK